MTNLADLFWRWKIIIRLGFFLMPKFSRNLSRCYSICQCAVGVKGWGLCRHVQQMYSMWGKAESTVSQQTQPTLATDKMHPRCAVEGSCAEQITVII